MEDFVTYEQAVKLKKLGFNWECNHWYHPLEPDKNIQCQTYCNHNSFERPYSAPTLSQVQKWLFEKHNIILLVDTYFKNYKNGDYSKAEFEYVRINMNFGAARKGSSKDGELFESYEEALSAGIDNALELLKEQ